MSLGRRNLTLLFGGLFVSELGSGATDVVVAWLVLQHTGSASLTGLVFVASSLAMLVGGPLGGLLADCLPRRRAMALADGLRLVLVAGLGAALLTGAFSLPLVLAVVFANAFLMLVFEGALGALVPALAGDALERVNGRLQAARWTGMLIGPAVGGVLLAATSHAGVALLLDAATYGVSLLAVLALPAVPAAAGAARAGLFAGLDAIRSVAALRRLTGLALSLSVVSPVFLLGFPLIARELGAGPAGYGALSCAFTLGFAVGGLPAGWIAERLGADRAIALGLAASGLASAFLGTAGSLAAAVALVLAGSLCVGPIEVLFMSGFQRAAPPDLIGRATTQLFSLNALVRAPAYALGGSVFAALGTAPVLAAAGALEIAVAVAYLASSRRRSVVPASSAARS
jgi:MFS family permease